jgi:tetratricopeptide (TPR) repeat protein
MYDTMSRLYPDVKYKGQYHIAPETFFLYSSIAEQLMLVLWDKEFSETHPDSFTRINQIRQKVEKDISSLMNGEEEGTVEWCEREVEIGFPRYTMKISDAVYAAYKKKFAGEILIWAAVHGMKDTGGKEFLTNLIRDVCKTTVSLPALNLPGLDEWKQGYFTRAILAFAACKVREEFSRVLAILYRSEYDHLNSKMESCLGQRPEFREGVDALQAFRLLYGGITEADDDKTVFDKLMGALDYALRAVSCFRNVLAASGPQDATLAFALGRAESACGFLYLGLGDIRAAITRFDQDIDNSPAALDSFYGRSLAHDLAGNADAARTDKAVWEIISRASSFLDRSWKFLTTGLGGNP